NHRHIFRSLSLPPDNFLDRDILPSKAEAARHDDAFRWIANAPRADGLVAGFAPPPHVDLARGRRPLAPAALSAPLPPLGRRSLHLSQFPGVGLSRSDAPTPQLPGSPVAVFVGRIDIAALARPFRVVSAFAAVFGGAGIVVSLLAVGPPDAAAVGP